MEANIRNTFPIIYSDLLGLFLFQFSAYTFKQTPSRTNMADAINITSLTNKSSKFYSAFAMSAALNILSFPFYHSPHYSGNIFRENKATSLHKI